MKRRLSESEYTRRWSVLQHRLRRRGQRESARRGHQLRLERVKQHREARIRHAPEVTLKAPQVFCLVENTEEVLKFFDTVSGVTESDKNVVLDFRDSSVVAPDGIVLLISRIRDRRLTHDMRIRVNAPSAPAPRRLWNDSGIREHVQLAQSDDEDWPEPRGRIITKRRYKAEPEDAVFLKNFAEQRLASKPNAWPGVQTILLECMTNTFNHAEGARVEQKTETHEPWWAGVYCDKENEVARFTFLDNGIGILESVRLKWAQEVLRRMGIVSNTEAMRQLLAGQVASTTGLPYRGEGLPSIREVLVAEQAVERIVIIANDVWVDIGSADYRLLPAPFPGTMVYWEKKGTWQAGF